MTTMGALDQALPRPPSSRPLPTCLEGLSFCPRRAPRPSPSLLLHAQVPHLAMPFLAFAADLIPNRLLKLPEAPILGITYFPSASKMFLCFSVTAFNTPRRGRVFPRLPAPRGCAVPAKPMLGLAVSAPGTRPCSAQGRGKKDGFRRQYRPGWKHPERDAPYHGVHSHWPPASSRGDDSQPISPRHMGLFKG